MRRLFNNYTNLLYCPRMNTQIYRMGKSIMRHGKCHRKHNYPPTGRKRTTLCVNWVGCISIADRRTDQLLAAAYRPLQTTIHTHRDTSRGIELVKNVGIWGVNCAHPRGRLPTRISTNNGTLAIQRKKYRRKRTARPQAKAPFYNFCRNIYFSINAFSETK